VERWVGKVQCRDLTNDAAIDFFREGRVDVARVSARLHMTDSELTIEAAHAADHGAGGIAWHNDGSAAGPLAASSTAAKARLVMPASVCPGVINPRFQVGLQTKALHRLREHLLVLPR